LTIGGVFAPGREKRIFPLQGLPALERKHSLEMVSRFGSLPDATKKAMGVAGGVDVPSCDFFARIDSASLCVDGAAKIESSNPADSPRKRHLG
jgi:hypothetical protein